MERGGSILIHEDRRMMIRISPIPESFDSLFGIDRHQIHFEYRARINSRSYDAPLVPPARFEVDPKFRKSIENTGSLQWDGDGMRSILSRILEMAAVDASQITDHRSYIESKSKYMFAPLLSYKKIRKYFGVDGLIRGSILRTLCTPISKSPNLSILNYYIVHPFTPLYTSFDFSVPSELCFPNVFNTRSGSRLFVLRPDTSRKREILSGWGIPPIRYYDLNPYGVI